MHQTIRAQINVLLVFFCLLPVKVSGQNNIDIIKSNINEKVGINQIHKGKIILQEILNSPKISFLDTNITKYKISSFRMTLIAPGMDSIQLENNQNGNLTESMIKVIRKYSRNARLIFDNILCMDGNQIIYNIEEFQLQLM